MAEEIKDTSETKDPRDGNEGRTFDEEMADINDTLDLKSPSEEESEEGKESEEKVEESSEGVEEEVDEGQKGEEAEKGELSEEEREIKEAEGIGEEEEKKEEVVEEEEETVASEEDELAFYKAQNKKLIERLNADPLPLKEEVSEPKPEEKKPETEIKPEDKSFKGFLKDGEDLDEIIESKEKFEELLNRVRNQSINDANQRVENILTSLPKLVIKHVQRQTLITQALDDFYRANEDLIVVKRQVGIIANEITADDPTLTLKEVFNKAATKTREVLGFKKMAGKIEKKRIVRKPTFKKQSRRSDRGSGPSLTDLESDVADTLEL